MLKIYFHSLFVFKDSSQKVPVNNFSSSIRFENIENSIHLLQLYFGEAKVEIKK